MPAEPTCTHSLFLFFVLKASKKIEICNAVVNFPTRKVIYVTLFWMSYKFSRKRKREIVVGIRGY